MLRAWRTLCPARQLRCGRPKGPETHGISRWVRPEAPACEWQVGPYRISAYVFPRRFQQKAPVLQFQTARLTIRQLRCEDAVALATYRSDPQVARYVPWTPPYTVERAHELIDRMLGRDFAHPGETGLTLAAVRTSDGLLIGDAMIKHEGNDPRRGGIGYVLAREHQGQGYATELAAGLVAHFFAGAASHRVAARCDARNAASMRVLERIGMRREGLLSKATFIKDAWVDECLYAMLRSEWISRFVGVSGAPSADRPHPVPGRHHRSTVPTDRINDSDVRMVAASAVHPV